MRARYSIGSLITSSSYRPIRGNETGKTTRRVAKKVIRERFKEPEGQAEVILLVPLWQKEEDNN
jgi:hypothetical protein